METMYVIDFVKVGKEGHHCYFTFFQILFITLYFHIIHLLLYFI